MAKRLNKCNFLRWDGEFSITESVSIIFAPVVNANISTVYTSNALTISGLVSAKPISISAGFEFKINGGAWITSGTINSGDVLVVRGTSSPSYSTPAIGTVTIGSSTGTFSISTKIAPMVAVNASIYQVPDPYVDVDLLVSVNGNFLIGLYSTEPTYPFTVSAGDFVSFVSHSPDGVWPSGAKRITTVLESGITIFEFTELTQNVLTYFQFQAKEGKTYAISTRTELSGGDSLYGVTLNTFGATIAFDEIMSIRLTRSNGDFLDFNVAFDPHNTTKYFPAGFIGNIAVEITNTTADGKYFDYTDGGVYQGDLADGDIIDSSLHPTGFSLRVNTPF